MTNPLAVLLLALAVAGCGRDSAPALAPTPSVPAGEASPVEPAPTRAHPGRTATAEPDVPAAARGARTAGRAYDHLTGAPLPRFAFRVGVDDGPPLSTRPSTRWTEVVTDAQGRFELGQELPRGQVRLEPFPTSECERQRSRFSNLAEFEPSDEGWELGFDVGPGFALALGGAVPAAGVELQAWLILEGTVQQAAQATVNRDDAPWVRFPESIAHWSGPLHLAVGDADGFVFGSAPLGGQAGGEVAIELAATGALEVRIGGEAPALLGGASDVVEWWRWQQVGLSIQVQPRARAATMPLALWRLKQRRYLPAGTYDVRAGSNRHRHARALAEVAAGSCAEVPLELELTGDTRTLHGVVRTQRGRELPNMTLLVRVEGDTPAGWSVGYAPMAFCANGADLWMHAEETAEGHVARFTLEEVPPGVVVVDAMVNGSGAESVTRARADGSLELEVLVLDDLDAPGYGFEVFTADGAQESAYWVHTRALDGGPPLHRYGEFGRPVARGNPAERRLEWAVVARGTQPVYGTQRDFEDRGEGPALARVTLAPGWGTRVVARDPEGRPLAGVEVALDGQPAGRTDARGELELTRDALPGRFDFRYGSWELVEGATVPNPVPVQSGPWHEVVLAPPG